MRVHVAFIPDEAAAAPTGVVIDVLRATSTIAQALAAGYERVFCVPEIDDARALRAELPDSIVGGERNAVRIDGFDVGASPREFLRSPEDVFWPGAATQRQTGGMLDQEQAAGRAFHDPVTLLVLPRQGRVEG